MREVKDKRKLKASERNYHRDKIGKGFNLERYNDISVSAYVPNYHTFKSVQIRLTFWIKIVEGTTEYEFSRMQSIIKKRIRNNIRDWQQPMFLKESIVAFNVGNADNIAAEFQYFLVDIVLYVKPSMEFHSTSIRMLVEPFIQAIIDEHFYSQEDLFSIHRNLKMENRNKKVREEF
jgi:hypothetical protein